MPFLFLRILRRSIRTVRRIRSLRRVIVISGHGVCAVTDGVACLIHRVSDGVACIVHAVANIITDGIRVGVVPLINSVVIHRVVGAIAVVFAVILAVVAAAADEETEVPIVIEENAKVGS